MKKMKRVSTIVLSIILWVIILIAALYAFTTMATRDNQKASLMGYTPMVVESDSMAPTFEKGDLIFIRKCDTSKLKEGDIICFHTIIDNTYALNTHRIQSITDNGIARSYTTIGDNNNGIADQHIISDGDIVGKYVGHWPKIGTVMNFLSGSIGFLLIIVIPMLIFFIYQVYHLIMISMRLKKTIAVEAALEVEEVKAKARQEHGEGIPEQADATDKEPENAVEESAPVQPEESAPAVQENRVEGSDAQLQKQEAEARKAEAEARKAEAEARKAEAEAALAEAKRLQMEAEAIRAKAEQELADAKQQKQSDDRKEGSEDNGEV